MMNWKLVNLMFWSTEENIMEDFEKGLVMPNIFSTKKLNIFIIMHVITYSGSIPITMQQPVDENG